ncbi:basic salivary proline-rich protein 4-like [Zootoca vivipara]|uniref:basic salivary proline-rich protein 4-like n=1 Tax=Zootoca vivipara TaxID=8524 RepID=UPI0015905292|nr:basic salivary proline-rich protein 4-like [Zootoca vivipara]XP_034958910.1 basic salivary proline-rich protein 4-like [Zootoca vivipara]XP_060125374.1 basic salivary proline-rich protein 4-like [Zootoca vivipara]XP_060125375.1 basic salivary proline-rich protein 4-like [Zootoca vivipara]XP_060125376.1 basic salivary proline-rich protein 4-like [Zootoca vivipara]
MHSRRRAGAGRTRTLRGQRAHGGRAIVSGLVRPLDPTPTPGGGGRGELSARHGRNTDRAGCGPADWGRRAPRLDRVATEGDGTPDERGGKRRRPLRLNTGVGRPAEGPPRRDRRCPWAPDVAFHRTRGPPHRGEVPTLTPASLWKTLPRPREHRGRSRVLGSRSRGRSPPPAARPPRLLLSRQRPEGRRDRTRLLTASLREPEAYDAARLPCRSGSTLTGERGWVVFCGSPEGPENPVANNLQAPAVPTRHHGPVAEPPAPPLRQDGAASEAPPWGCCEFTPIGGVRGSPAVPVYP